MPKFAWRHLWELPNLLVTSQNSRLENVCINQGTINGIKQSYSYDGTSASWKRLTSAIFGRQILAVDVWTAEVWTLPHCLFKHQQFNFGRAIYSAKFKHRGLRLYGQSLNLPMFEHRHVQTSAANLQMGITDKYLRFYAPTINLWDDPQWNIFKVWLHKIKEQ